MRLAAKHRVDFDRDLNPGLVLIDGDVRPGSGCQPSAGCAEHSAAPVHPDNSISIVVRPHQP